MLHLLLASLVATMVLLGFWQLDRRDEKRAINNAVIERTAEAPVEISQLLESERLDPSTVEWRPVTVTGRYLADAAVTIINRSQDGTPGYSPLAALEMADGRVVFVNRGFVPLNETPPSTPDGEVEVVGFVRPTQTRGALGAIDSNDPEATEFHRIDIELISQRLDAPHLPVYVQLANQTPPQSAPWPAPVGLPELDEGPHLSYAFQWWFFSLVALTGWIVVSRRAINGARMPLARG